MRMRRRLGRPTHPHLARLPRCQHEQVALQAGHLGGVGVCTHDAHVCCIMQQTT
jgi:hypothetical protein